MLESNEGCDINQGAGHASQRADASPSPRQTAGGPKPPAKRGGGPRTAAGKLASSRNATKHGLFSASPVAGAENEDDYNARLQAFREDIKPEGAVQEALVHIFSVAYERKLRVMEYESGLINARYEARRPSWSWHPRSAREQFLDDLDCNLAEAVALLERLDGADDSVSFQAVDVTNALFLPAVLCTDDPLPD